MDEILASLEQALRRDGRDVRRLPHRLHWVLWLLADLDPDPTADSIEPPAMGGAKPGVEGGGGGEKIAHFEPGRARLDG